jgi:hypothetical protein
VALVLQALPFADHPGLKRGALFRESGCPGLLVAERARGRIRFGLGLHQPI